MPTFTNGGAIAFAWVAIAIGMFLFWLIDDWNDRHHTDDQDAVTDLDVIESDLLWAELDHWNNRTTRPYNHETDGL